MPTDIQTGLPLPILPIEAPNWQGNIFEDYHHSWFQRRDPRLKGEGGLALRYSMGQDLPRWLHIATHQKLGPPPLPKEDDRSEQFRLVALGAAGLIGPYALSLNADRDFDVVRMIPDEYVYVTNPRRLHIETYKPAQARMVRTHLGKFFASYALEQNLDHISARIIKDFLHTKNAVRKQELGNLLLRESVEVAIAPLKQIKKEAGALYEMPWFYGIDLARKIRAFFPKTRFAEYYQVLAKRLQAIV